MRTGYKLPCEFCGTITNREAYFNEHDFVTICNKCSSYYFSKGILVKQIECKRLSDEHRKAMGEIAEEEQNDF